MEVVVEDREAADGQGLCLSFSGFPGPWLRVMPVLFRLVVFPVVRFPVVGPLAFAGGAESPPLHC